MKKNIGKTDKIVRLIVAIIFLILYLTNIVNGIFGNMLLALGIIFVVTALINFCPLYLPFRINTAGSADSSNNSSEEK